MNIDIELERIRAGVKAEVRARVQAKVNTTVGAKVSAQVSANVRAKVRANARHILEAEVKAKELMLKFELRITLQAEVVSKFSICQRPSRSMSRKVLKLAVSRWFYKQK